MNGNGHPTRMSEACLDVAIYHHRRSDIAHGTHPDRIPEFLQFQFQFGNFGIGITIPDCSKASGLFAKLHACIF